MPPEMGISHGKSPKTIAIIVFTIAIILIALCGAAFYVSQTGIIQAYLFMHSGAKDVPQELRGVLTVIRQPGEPNKVVYVQGNGFAAITTPANLAVREVVGQRNNRIVLGSMPDGSVVISKDGSVITSIPNAASTDSSPFAKVQNLAISANGTQIAYAKLRGSLDSILDPSAWEVYQIALPNGSPIDVGPGFAAFFFSDNTLLRFTKNGIVKGGVSSGAFAGPFTSSIMHISQSPDRTLLAWIDPTSKSINVYKIYGGDTTHAPSATRIGSIKTQQQTFTLGNTALYTYTFSNPFTAVNKYNFDNVETPAVWNVPFIVTSFAFPGS